MDEYIIIRLEKDHSYIVNIKTNQGRELIFHTVRDPLLAKKYESHFSNNGELEEAIEKLKKYEIKHTLHCLKYQISQID